MPGVTGRNQRRRSVLSEDRFAVTANRARHLAGRLPAALRGSITASPHGLHADPADSNARTAERHDWLVPLEQS